MIYQEPPEVVIKYKERHPRFVDVHYVVYEEKREKEGKVHRGEAGRR